MTAMLGVALGMANRRAIFAGVPATVVRDRDDFSWPEIADTGRFTGLPLVAAGKTTCDHEWSGDIADENGWYQFCRKCSATRRV